MAEQLRFRHHEATTNWGAPDDRYAIHFKEASYLSKDKGWTEFTVPEYNAFADAATEWCRINFRKPFHREMNKTGLWYTSSDRKMFVFRRKDHAMLFKLTWSA